MATRSLANALRANRLWRGLGLWPRCANADRLWRDSRQSRRYANVHRSIAGLSAEPTLRERPSRSTI
ncbi:MAG: hypothetical protein F6K55_19150 [Moorea sp. SIO4A3]|nr:hypothetical protein [Moorena sp. SIO4A3]